jgi:hypothetical protein
MYSYNLFVIAYENNFIVSSNVACSRHDTDQNLLIYPETIITDSLTTF